MGGGGGGGPEQASELATTNGPAAVIPVEPNAADEQQLEGLQVGGRDPFSPQVVADTGGGATSSGPTTASAPAPQMVLDVVPPTAPPAESAPPAETAPQGEAPDPDAPVFAPQPAQQSEQAPAEAPARVTVLRVSGGTADIQIDDEVFTGRHAKDVLTDRFNLDEFKGECVFMKDMYRGGVGHHDRFQVCKGASVDRT
jgi:hypothetical protein